MGIVEKWIKIIEEEYIDNLTFSPLTIYVPPADILVSEENILVLIEIPGVKKEDMKLKISHDSIHLEGIKRSFSDEDRYQYYNMERYAGRFRRILKLPFQIDVNHVKAEYSDGILRIELRKKQKPLKRIEIE